MQGAFGLLLSMLILPLARAEIAPQPFAESFSRALQQAKRVAAMENSHDLPSRTEWMTERAAGQSKELASRAVQKKQKKARERRSDTL